MYLNQFESTSQVRLQQILATLNDVHGVTINIDLDSPTAEFAIKECQSAWELTRNRIIAESSFNSYQLNPGYTKAMLILEAMKIMLTEIGPKRRRKSTKMHESIMEDPMDRKLYKITYWVTQKSRSDAPDREWHDEEYRYGTNPEDVKDRFLNSNRTRAFYDVKVVPATPKEEAAYRNNLDEDTNSKPTISTQLSDIAANVPQSTQQSTAFSNALSGIADKLAARGTSFASDLDTHEKEIMSWIKSLPRPINVGNMINAGIEKFGKDLLDARMSHIASLPKVDTDEAVSVVAAKPSSHANPGMDNVHENLRESDTLNPQMIGAPRMPGNATFGQAHHYEYQASMARSELYRNAKYAMSMLKQVDPQEEIQPWIAACLTKAANMLDKVYHYLDYYKTFEPAELPEDIEGDVELGETSGSIARENLMLIMEYSTKLFNLIKPGDKLEGWVAMKLTTASECLSSSKHYMDYVQFEHHALDDHFDEARRAKRNSIAESHLYEDVDPNSEELAKATLIINAKAISGKVQDMAEDVAKLGVNELMPLVDSMRSQFGPDAAAGFNDTVKAALDNLLNVTTETKETIDAATTTLQSGGVPSEQTDIEQAGDTEAPPDNTDISADMAALGGEESEEPEENPEAALGRAKKPVAESWNAKMHTAEKDKGKWDGYTLAELKAKKSNLMKKATRTAAEQKTVKQIDFAIRAKQKNKWGKIKEGAMTCNECGVGTYMEDTNGKMCCNECGAMMMSEKYDPHAAEVEKAKKEFLAKGGKITQGPGKDAKGSERYRRAMRGGHIGRTGSAKADAPSFREDVEVNENWPGYKKNMANQKAKPSDADKQWDKITKINSDHPVVEGIFSRKPKPVVTRLSPPTPSELKAQHEVPLKKGEIRVTKVTPDMLRKERELEVPAYIRRGQKTETTVDEVAPPGKKAEDFITGNKEAFKKRYGKNWESILYATAWKQFGPKKEGYDQAVAALAEANRMFENYSKEMSAHKAAFKRQLAEGKATDPLNVGYGLEGESIRQSMISAQRKIAEQKSVVRQIMQEGVIGMLQSIELLNKAKELTKVKNETPFGVIYETKSGRKAKKMFENAETRRYWLDLNGSKISNPRMIEPETFEAAINKKIKA